MEEKIWAEDINLRVFCFRGTSTFRDWEKDDKFSEIEKVYLVEYTEENQERLESQRPETECFENEEWSAVLNVLFSKVCYSYMSTAGIH